MEQSSNSKSKITKGESSVEFLDETEMEIRLLAKMEDMIQRSFGSFIGEMENRNNNNSNNRKQFSNSSRSVSPTHTTSLPLDSNSNSNRNVQFRPASAINRAEEDVGDSSSGIILDGSDISNKRTANEIAVLDKILKLATMEDGGDDLKLKMVKIQLEAQKRIFLLEMASKVGWGVALAYQQLFPKDLCLVPTKLKEAIDYSETIARVEMKKKRIFNREKENLPATTTSFATAASNKGKGKFVPYGKYETCFRCGGKGHWVKDCPNGKPSSRMIDDGGSNDGSNVGKVASAKNN